MLPAVSGIQGQVEDPELAAGEGVLNFVKDIHIGFAKPPVHSNHPYPPKLDHN